MTTYFLLTGFLIALFVLKVGGQEVIQREYDNWAPALARALVRCAGLIYPGRASHWANEILNVQRYGDDERESGLWFAADVLVEALRTRLIESIRRFRPALPEPEEPVAPDSGRPKVTIPGASISASSRKGDRLAACCRPRFPDRIVAYVSRDGYRIHRPGCGHIQRLRHIRASECFLKAAWVEEPSEPYGKLLAWANFRTEISEGVLEETIQASKAKLVHLELVGAGRRTALLEIEPLAGSNTEQILRAIARAGAHNYRFVRSRDPNRRVQIEPPQGG